MIDATRGEGLPRNPDAGPEDFDEDPASEYWALRSRIYERAKELALRHRLTEDQAQDIAEEAFAELWKRRQSQAEPPSPASITKLIGRHAARKAKRKARTRRRLQMGQPQPARRGRSLPSLCARLAALAAYHPDPGRFLKTLLAAATRLAHEPGVLRASQLSAFLLAYEDVRPLSSITETLGAPSMHAMVQRLRRVSRRLGSRLVRRMGKVLPPLDRRRLGEWLRQVPKSVHEKKNLKKVASASLTRLSVRVEEAVRSLFPG
ncbi:MAG: hypothetical protein ACE5JG_04100 [Planctomycetota bacterium]